MRIAIKLLKLLFYFLVEFFFFYQEVFHSQSEYLYIQYVVIDLANIFLFREEGYG